MWNSPKFIEPMLMVHISGFASSAAARRSWTVMFWPPPVVMLMTASVRRLDAGQELAEHLRVGRRPAGPRVAGVEMDDRRARLGRAERRLRDLLGRDGQVRRHRRRVDGARDGARDDDLVPRRDHAALPCPVRPSMLGRREVAYVGFVRPGTRR